MIVPIIMAIWFGIVARKAGRNWFGWGLAGAAMSFIVNTIVRNVGIFMFGPFSLDVVVPFIIISTAIAIVITIIIGALITSSFRKQPTPTADTNVKPKNE